MHENLKKTLLVTMFAILAFHLLFHTSPLTGFMGYLPIALGMWGLSAFAITNSWLMLGHRHMLVFLALGAVIGFSAEQIGVSSGWVFGRYEYTDVLGARIGHVPLVIPACWFMIVYLSHIIANLVIAGRPVLISSGYRRLLMALVTAAIATAYDVAMDPTMAGKSVGAWIWAEEGAYLGVPFRNYGGWMGTAFAIDYLYRSFQFRKPPHPKLSLEPLLAAGVVFAYGTLGLFWMLVGDPAATQLIALYVMGIPTLIAAVSLVRWDQNHARKVTP